MSSPTASLLRHAQDLEPVPLDARRGLLETGILPLACKAKSDEAIKARRIAEAAGAAGRAREGQPVER